MSNEIEQMKSDYAKEALNPRSATTVRWGLAYEYPRYCVHSRETAVARLLQSVDFAFDRIQYKTFLDIGCGDGFTLREWVRLGARPTNCHGVDAIEDRIKEAKEISPNMHFKVEDAKALSYPDKSFDVISLYTVLSSVKSEESKIAIMKEAKRLLAPNGLLFVYEQKGSSDRVDGVSKLELFKISDIDWIVVELIPEGATVMMYEDMVKKSTKKGQKFTNYIALAKRR